jgi:hypothetical protein
VTAGEKQEEDAMRRLVEFPSDTGEPILVERAQTSFEDALDKAKPMATSLVGKLRAIV